ncbi:response regulator transcription factor [Sorangium sp. So ce1128]
MARILLADDDASLLDVLTLAFEEAGHATQTARDGATALALIRKERPEAAVCDVNMPGVDGSHRDRGGRRLPLPRVWRLIPARGAARPRSSARCASGRPRSSSPCCSRRCSSSSPSRSSSGASGRACSATPISPRERRPRRSTRSAAPRPTTRASARASTP